jgi:hypothetical protein
MASGLARMAGEGLLSPIGKKAAAKLSCPMLRQWRRSEGDKSFLVLFFKKEHAYFLLVRSS